MPVEIFKPLDLSHVPPPPLRPIVLSWRAPQPDWDPAIYHRVGDETDIEAARRTSNTLKELGCHSLIITQDEKP